MNDTTTENSSVETLPAHSAESLEGSAMLEPNKLDPECICHGNWRAIIKESAPLLGRRYIDSKGKVWTFFGVVHGEDDYYYGMWREGELRLLSCVGSIEGHDFKLLDKPRAGDMLPEAEVVRLFSPERGFTDKSAYPYVEGEWTCEKGAEAFIRAVNRSEAWTEARRLMARLRHQTPANTDDPQKTHSVLSALEAAERALLDASAALNSPSPVNDEKTQQYLSEVIAQVRGASALLQYRPKEQPYEPKPQEGPGVPCPHCNATGKEPQVYDEENGWSPEGPCETCKGAGKLYTVEQYLLTLPADFHKDSSLETWFPITAEELRRLREENKQLKREISLRKLP